MKEKKIEKIRKEIKEKSIGRIFETTQSGGPPLDGIHICVTSSEKPLTVWLLIFYKNKKR